MLKYPMLLLSRLLIVLTCFLAGCSTVMQKVPGTSLATLGAQPKNVALLLPLQGEYADSASAIRNGFFAAYYYDKQNNPSVANVSVVDTSGSDIRNTYSQAIQKGANFVVGPLTKPNVQSLMNSSAAVPTIALNNPETTASPPSNVFFFSLSPRDESIQVAEKAIADGHHNAIIIAPATSWGQNSARAFAEAWQAKGGNIVGNLSFAPKQDLVQPMANLLHVDKSVISSKGFKEAQKKKMPLSQMRRNDFDMVFLAASPQQARLIKPLLNFYFAGNVPVYATSSVYSGTPAPQYDNDLNGIIFADMPWVVAQNQLSPATSAIKSHVTTIWANSYNSYSKLYAMGVDAYYLTSNLGRVASGASVPGATGTLYLGSQHQINRRLTWAQFRNGVPQPL